MLVGDYFLVARPLKRSVLGVVLAGGKSSRFGADKATAVLGGETLRREHEEAIARLQDERERLRRRIHEMYIDKLDGRVDPDFYDRMSREWQLHLVAPKLLEKNPPHEKRRLLNFLLSNSVWKDRKLTASFR